MFKRLALLAAGFFWVTATLWAGDEERILANVPKDVPGMKFGGIRKFDVPGAGASAAYNSTTGTGLTVTVILYDAGRDKIPEGPDTDVARADMNGSVATLKDLAKQGLYKNLKLTEPKDKVRFGKRGIKFLATEAAFNVALPNSDQEQTIKSFIFLTGWNNRLLKIRVSHNQPSKAKEAEKEMRALLNQVVDSLK
jgi:hypothetical protein